MYNSFNSYGNSSYHSLYPIITVDCTGPSQSDEFVEYNYNNNNNDIGYNNIYQPVHNNYGSLYPIIDSNQSFNNIQDYTHMYQPIQPINNTSRSLYPVVYDCQTGPNQPDVIEYNYEQCNNDCNSNINQIYHDCNTTVPIDSQLLDNIYSNSLYPIIDTNTFIPDANYNIPIYTNSLYPIVTSECPIVLNNPNEIIEFDNTTPEACNNTTSQIIEVDNRSYQQYRADTNNINIDYSTMYNNTQSCLYPIVTSECIVTSNDTNEIIEVDNTPYACNNINVVDDNPNYSCVNSIPIYNTQSFLYPIVTSEIIVSNNDTNQIIEVDNTPVCDDRSLDNINYSYINSIPIYNTQSSLYPIVIQECYTASNDNNQSIEYDTACDNTNIPCDNNSNSNYSYLYNSVVSNYNRHSLYPIITYQCSTAEDQCLLGGASSNDTSQIEYENTNIPTMQFGDYTDRSLGVGDIPSYSYMDSTYHPNYSRPSLYPIVTSDFSSALNNVDQFVPEYAQYNTNISQFVPDAQYNTNINQFIPDYMQANEFVPIYNHRHNHNYNYNYNSNWYDQQNYNCYEGNPNCNPVGPECNLSCNFNYYNRCIPLCTRGPTGAIGPTGYTGPIDSDKDVPLLIMICLSLSLIYFIYCTTKYI